MGTPVVRACVCVCATLAGVLLLSRIFIPVKLIRGLQAEKHFNTKIMETHHTYFQKSYQHHITFKMLPHILHILLVSEVLRNLQDMTGDQEVYESAKVLKRSFRNDLVTWINKQRISGHSGHTV
jgi:hypothetical protein